MNMMRFLPALSLALLGPPLHAEPTSTEAIMTAELSRAMEVLGEQEEAPHYIALAVEAQERLQISAASGTLSQSDTTQRRYLDVDLRVGSPELDSSHPIRGIAGFRATGRSPVIVPVSDDPAFAFKQILWRELNDRYRAASEAIVVLRTSQTVLVEEEDPAPDFEVREPVVAQIIPTPFDVDKARWEKALVAMSQRLTEHPRVTSERASLTALTSTKTFVDTEGTRLTHGTTHLRVMVSASAVADDGDNISVTRYLDVHEASGLPDEAELMAWADAVTAQIDALLTAPRGEPYSGPVMLKGKAAAVFFHEVLGHRVEGHRQKRDSEGKTFARYVGRPILPEFIDVYDDPTINERAGIDLNGTYHFDDEGVAAARAQIVEDGVFVGFLMGRSPINGFEHSNGHGRRQLGRAPVARMGNLFIDSAQPHDAGAMRAMLIKEIKAQGLEYGIIVEEIQGGFTLTGRVIPNAFNVRASTSWKVYADGRPDELIRGIDLVGTPLVAFGNLKAAGGEREVFNGYCGAESGMVPVSAVAPSILFTTLEFQLKEKGSNKPPLLEKPVQSEGGSAALEEGVQHEG